MALLGESAAWAQSETGEAGEIVVTALRRTTALQDTPISIAVVSGDSLAQKGAVDFIDFAASVPGFTIRDNGPGQRRPVLRGVQGAGEAQVGTYYDEFPITSSPGATNDAGRFAPDIKLVDIERVEVLRGPQGTLFGSGSVGGTLRVVTAKPDLADYSGRVSGQAGFISHGGHQLGVDGMINVPVIEDRLGLRLVAYSQHDDGYIDNDYLQVKDINRSSVAGGRLSVRAKPVDGLTVDVFALYQKFKSDAGNATIAAVGAYSSDLPAYDPFDDEVQLYGATVQYEMPFATLTANASYYKRDLFFNFLFPNLGIPFTTPAVTGTAIVQQPQKTTAKTYELRLASPDRSDVFTWTIGAFRQERDAFTRSNLPFAGADGRPDPTLPRFQDRTIKSFIDQTAFFGEASYTLFGRLTATAGIRWFDYKVGSRQAFQIATGGGVPADPGVYTGAPPFSQSDYITKFGLSYKVTDDILIYALRSEGFRPGGANQTVSPTIPVGFSSDDVTSYEGGIKSQWFDRRLTFNLSYYHLIWDGIQVDGSTPDGLFRFTTNAGQAKVDGVELELSARPWDDVSLGLGYGYVNARLTEDQPFVPGVPRRGLSGQDIPAVPRHSLNGWAEKSVPVSTDLTASFRMDAQYVSASQNMFNPFLVSTATGTPTNTPDPYFARYDGYVTVDVSVGIASKSNWTLRLLANNLLDEQGVTYVFKDNFRPAGYTYRIRPRTIGLSFSIGL